MRAADTSRGFFPSNGADLVAGPSKSPDINENASFLPDVSSPTSRTRKLSNKLMKKRPTLRNGSTPPSSFRGTPAPTDDFVEAVTAQVDMLTSSLPRKPTKKSERALAERSFASPLGMFDETSTGSRGPSRSQNSDSTASTTSSNSHRSLQRSSSSIQLGSASRSSPQTPPQPDPFGRGPVVLSDRASPFPVSGPMTNVFGSAATRYAGEDMPMKKWTPKDNRGTIIALYKSPTSNAPPASGPSRFPQPQEVDDTVIALYKPPPSIAPQPPRAYQSSPIPPLALRGRSHSVAGNERDDTIIALYKLPPPTSTDQPPSSLQLPAVRDAPWRRSNSLAFVPGSGAAPPSTTFPGIIFVHSRTR